MLKEETEQRVRANGQRVVPLCSLLSQGLCDEWRRGRVVVVCVVWYVFFRHE